MKTVKKLEKQKLKIITKLVTTLNNEINPKLAKNKTKLLDMIKQLQPPLLTCSTCDKSESSCNVVHHIPNINENKDFGCIKHSDYYDL